jgi:hypothetical protein
MPKNNVSDPITDQEMAFAHLVLSGTMNDRRAAVREKPVDQEAEGLRNLNLGRDQILTRLWELANLSSEATRGSIAGQVKALAMIVAIEGLIPNRRLSPTQNQPATPPSQPQIHTAEWLRPPQRQAEGTEPGDATKVQAARSPEPKSPPHPAPKPAINPSSLNLDRNPSSVLNPFIDPAEGNWVPAATGSIFDAALDAINSTHRPFLQIGIAAKRPESAKRLNFIEFYKLPATAGMVAVPSWSCPRARL